MTNIEKQDHSKQQVNGFLNLCKPQGISSMDVVRHVKRLTGFRKRVGHAGTLDPLAEGVLPVCLGQATRLMEYVIDSLKHYRTVVRLGVTTSTYDAEGDILCRKEVGNFDALQVEEALDSFRGTIYQIPPMYSALKRDGKRLYKLARAGMDVKREPRKVKVARIELVEYSHQELVLDVECGRGMYLRSLAHDLGQALGCGAHLTKLNRLRTGHFLVKEAITFDQFETACREDSWQALVSSPDFVVRHLKGVRVGLGLEKLLRDGQPINLGAAYMNAAYLENYRAYSTEGHFIGLIKFHRSQGVWKPDKVFKLENPSPYAPTS